MTWWSKWVQHLLFLSFYSILNICLYHQVCKIQFRVSVYYQQDTFVASRGYRHQLNLTVMSRAFPQRLCLSSVFLVGRLYSGILCLIECKRNESRFSSFLLCYNTHISTYFMNLKIAICQFQPLPDPRKGFFSWASTSPTLMYPWNSQSNFHRTVPHVGIPLIDQFFHCSSA